MTKAAPNSLDPLQSLVLYIKLSSELKLGHGLSKAQTTTSIKLTGPWLLPAFLVTFAW
jgi:hypothetical protein